MPQDCAAMTTDPAYLPAADRYESFPYRRVGRSGLVLPAVSLGLWHNFGDDKPVETQRAILRRAFDRGVTHFDLANNYGPPYGAAETNFGRIFREDFRAVPGRAGHLDQGGLRHVARAVRRRRLAQVPARQPGPVAGPDGPGPRRHLLLPPVRPGHAAGGDDGRPGHRRPLRPGDLRRHLVVLPGADPRGGRDPARPRHAAADPPAVVLDAQPLGRGRRAVAARRPGGRGRRLHRVLAAGPGDADRPLPGRHPRGARGPPRASRWTPGCSPSRA